MALLVFPPGVFLNVVCVWVQACRVLNDSGTCKKECPPLTRYNPKTHLVVNNPDAKFAFGATCVKACPRMDPVFNQQYKSCPVGAAYRQQGALTLCLLTRR